MLISTLGFVLVCMTLAFGFYCAALVYSRKNTKIHIAFAICGFALDMFATYIMEAYGRMFVTNFSSILLYTHTAFAIVAMFLFLTIAYLGARRHPKHPYIARFIFLPTWIISYVLGVALII